MLRPQTLTGRPSSCPGARQARDLLTKHGEQGSGTSSHPLRFCVRVPGCAGMYLCVQACACMCRHVHMYLFQTVALLKCLAHMKTRG